MADRRPMEPTVETRSAHLQISPASPPPLTAEVASSFFIEVELQYDGDSPLYWATEEPITLAYRWLQPDTQEVFVADGARTGVGLFIASGERRVVRARIFAPDSPKNAILRVSCVAEGYFWFCERFPTGWFDLPIEIVPAGRWPEQLRDSPAAKALRGALSANVLRQSIGRASFVGGFSRNPQVDGQQPKMVEIPAPAVPEPPRQVIPQIEPFAFSLPPFPAAPTRVLERLAEVDVQPDPLPAGWGGRAARSLDKMVASTSLGAAVDRIARKADLIAVSLDRHVSDQDRRDVAQQDRVEWLEFALREALRGIEQLSSHCVSLERRQIATEGHLTASEARIVTTIDEMATGLSAQISAGVSDTISVGARLDQTYAHLAKFIQDSADHADRAMLVTRRANELLRSSRDDIRELALGQQVISASVVAIDAQIEALGGQSFAGMAELLEVLLENRRATLANLESVRTHIARLSELSDARGAALMARIDEASTAIAKTMNDSLAREGVGFGSKVSDLSGDIGRKIERANATLLANITESGDARLATLNEGSVSRLAKLLEPFFESQRATSKNLEAIRVHLANLGEVGDARASNLMARIEETGNAVTEKLSDSLAREGIGFRTEVGDLGADISRNLDRALASLSTEINEAMNARIASLGTESASGLAERLKPIFENQRTTSTNLDSIRAHIASLGEKSDARASHLMARIEEASHAVTDRLNASLAEEGIGFRTEVGDLGADVRRNLDEAVKALVAQFNETVDTSAIGTSVGQILDNAAAEAVIIRNISDKVDHLLWRQVFAADAQKMTFCRNSWGLFGIPEHDVEAIAYYASGTVPEPGTMNVVDRLLAPGMTFVDVGANIGLFTIAAARRVGPTGKVISLEPDRTTAAALATTIRVNGVEPIVTLHNCAAGSHSEQRKLYLGRTSGHNSLVKLSDVDATIEVDVKTLDEIIGSDPVHVVKIDVEGWELHVLAGAQNVINNNPDAYFILEFGPSHLVRSGDTIKHWLRTIKKLGFKVFEIDEDAITVRPLRASGLDEVVSVNLLLAKELPSTLQIG